MKRNYLRFAALGLGLFVVASISTPALAQARKAMSEEELMRQPGYVEFGDIWKWSDGDQEMEIHLTQPLLGVVSSFLKGDDPQLADLVLELHLVKVNGFSFARSDEDDVRKFMDDTATKLRGDDWDNIVKVRERGERINVFVKFEGDGQDPSDTFLSGLTVLVLEDEKATFVNIVGRFRLEDIARVGEHFDIPHADEWGGDIEHYNRRGSHGSDEGGGQ